jgi:hypothetical protein
MTTVESKIKSKSIRVAILLIVIYIEQIKT